MSRDNTTTTITGSACLCHEQIKESDSLRVSSRTAEEIEQTVQSINKKIGYEIFSKDDLLRLLLDIGKGEINPYDLNPEQRDRIMPIIEHLRELSNEPERA